MFQTTLIQDYLKEILGITNPIIEVFTDHSGGVVMVKMEEVNNHKWENIYVLSLMDFIYSKIKSQETEAPTPTIQIGLEIHENTYLNQSKMYAEATNREVVLDSQGKEVLEFPFIGQDFQDAWSKFNDSRIEVKKPPLSLKKIKQIFKRLSNCSEKDAIEALEDSIRNGWGNVYPINKTT